MPASSQRTQERPLEVRRLGLITALITSGSAQEQLIFLPLLALAAIGILSPHEYNVAPTKAVLVISVILCAATQVRKLRAGSSILVTAGIYFVFKALLMHFFKRAALSDFVEAYLAYIYLIPLAFMVASHVFNLKVVARVTTVLLFCFLIKYGYSEILGYSTRPGLLAENNYELILLEGLFYLSFPALGARRHQLFFLLAVTVIISGSRSASVALVLLYVVLYVRKTNRRWPLHVMGVVVVAYAVLRVFIDRENGETLDEIDRYRFFQIFLREVHGWPLWKFGTGSFPLTPLSQNSCATLAYYQKLFSQSRPGVCYSVILHAYILRGLFDQGVIGFGLLYLLIWTGLKRSGASRRDRVTIVGIITISAFSVSAFNSEYTTVLLAVTFGLRRVHARLDVHEPPVHREGCRTPSEPDGWSPPSSGQLCLERRNRAG